MRMGQEVTLTRRDILRPCNGHYRCGLAFVLTFDAILYLNSIYYVKMINDKI